VNVLFLGNPNVGKTSIFNHLTGSSARVGNYPGVTVERRVASCVRQKRSGEQVTIRYMDTPGTYSLSARSREEQITIQAVLGLAGLERPDRIVAVINATQLSRNLYMVCQLLELRAPTVIAVTMLDEAGEAAPDLEELSALLGVKCISVHGDTGEGTRELEAHLLNEEIGGLPRLNPAFSPHLIHLADKLVDCLPKEWRGSVERDRTLAFWALLSLEDDDELDGIPATLRERVNEARESGDDYDLEIAQTRSSQSRSRPASSVAPNKWIRFCCILCGVSPRFSSQCLWCFRPSSRGPIQAFLSWSFWLGKLKNLFSAR
jgi:ferrous iron transport protein B